MVQFGGAQTTIITIYVSPGKYFPVKRTLVQRWRKCLHSSLTVHGSFKFWAATVHSPNMIRKHSNMTEEILIGAPHLRILSPADDWWPWSPHPSCEHTGKSDWSRLVCCFRTRDRERKKRTTGEREQKWGKVSWKQRGTGAKNKQRSEEPNSAVWFRFEPSVSRHVGETSHTSWCAALPPASPLSSLSPVPHLSLQKLISPVLPPSLTFCLATPSSFLSWYFWTVSSPDLRLPPLLVPCYLSRDRNEPRDKFF